MNALSLSIVLLVSHLRYGYHQIREVNLIILIRTSSGNQIVLCRGSLFFFSVARVHDMTSDVHRQLVRIMGFPNWSQALFPLCSSWDISLGFPFLFFISFMKRYPLAICCLVTLTSLKLMPERDNTGFLIQLKQSLA